MSKKSNLTIGSKIQIAISVNIVLAVLIGEYLVSGLLGLEGTKGVLVNLLINSAIAFVFGLLVSRAITRPLREQLLLLNKMAAGKGDLTQRLEASSNDEVGQLSETFNGFVQHLQEIMLDVLGSTNSLAASVQYFSHMGADISNGAEKQTNQTDQIVREIEALAAQVTSIADNTQNAKDMALASEESAERGGSVVEKTIHGMGDVSETVYRGAETIQHLKGSVDTIGSMVGTIRGIADQTNLLALNAAIEAARAGENGRGFAVVADEVRALAARTGEATHEIGRLIDTMQGNLAETIELMDAGVEQVAQGVSLSNEAGEVLKDIVTRSQQVAAMVQDIAAGVGEQSKITNSITEEVETVAGIAKQNGSSVQQVVVFSKDLKSQTQHLKDVVGEFKLSRGDATSES